MNDYQSFIHKSRYARYLDSEGRRETWTETVDRYINFMEESAQHRFPMEIRPAMLNMLVVPSMRALMVSGRALEQASVMSFTASWVAIRAVSCLDHMAQGYKAPGVAVPSRC